MRLYTPADYQAVVDFITANGDRHILGIPKKCSRVWVGFIEERNGKLEVLDFKTQRRPKLDDPLTERYYKQLCLYSHILKERHGKNPERLYIYWTGEKSRRAALMQFPVDERNIQRAGDHFDQVVRSIRSEDFSVGSPPTSTVCKECDFRTYCDGQGTIKFKFRHLKRCLRGAELNG